VSGEQRFPIKAADSLNALCLQKFHGEDIRYCPEWGKWLTWTGTHWEADTGGQMIRRMIDVHERSGNDRSGSWDGMRCAWKIAAGLDGIETRAALWDTDHHLLNCPNGIVDLKTGELLPHDRGRLCTNLAGCDYDPLAFGAGFHNAVSQMFCNNIDLIRFVRYFAGYSLTGETKEQCLPLLHGGGSNGKSLLLELMKRAAGTYACAAAPGLLLEHSSEQHPTGVADLQGKRFVISSEAGEGRRLAEELLKRLTGSDTLKARKMRQDFFEFASVSKFWLAANHKPQIKGTDDGIWRRILLVPFDAKFVHPEEAKEGDLVADLGLLDRITEDELPSVLNWMVLGATSWYAEGLRPPEIVRARSEEYRFEMDTFSEFEEECVRKSPGGRGSNAGLRAVYQGWAKDNGIKYTLGPKEITQEMTKRGYRQGGNGGRQWMDVTFVYTSQQFRGEAAEGGCR
jgi:putative DNA primase/helicase